MDVFYHAAEWLVDTAQRSLNGGFITFVLDQLADSREFSQYLYSPPLPIHFVNTIGSGGFLAGIFFGFLWCFGLLVGFIYMCWLRRQHAKKRTSPQSMKKQFRVNSLKSSGTESLKKSNLFLRRRQLQSKWMCIASQCATFTTLVGLLFLSCILGFVTSYSLHSTLTADPHLPSINNTSPKLVNNGLFPGITLALQSTRAFMVEFPTEVRISTEPVVDKLIRATVKMQNKTTHEFNVLLFNMLGIDRAFDLGDKLGSHTVKLLNLVTPLKSHLIEYTDKVSSLSVAIARWNGYMEQLHVEKNLTAMKSCEFNADCRLPILAQADVTVSSNWRLPQFDFVIALNFVTDAQNRTPEVIEEQLKSSRLLAARQLEKTFERMSAEIDIPSALRNLTEENWMSIAEHLSVAIAQLDNLTDTMPKKFHPLVVVGSNYLFAICCLVWLSMISIALAISLLLYHFHCVNGPITAERRQRIRCYASFVLIILIFCVVFSCVLFLLAGYARTELCRYISPRGAVTEAAASEPPGRPGASFVLDTHVNHFLDRNWDRIVEMVKEMRNTSKAGETPIPRLRSPIYALNVACRENAGILDAFGAVETFNFTLLTKPEMANAFVSKGRDIMRDALLELNATEMFPPALTESVHLASRLDDFLIPFDKVRRELPKNFLNVTSKNTTMLMPGTELAHLWREYYSFLNKSRLPPETLSRADELTSIVFNLSSEIKTLLESVDDSLQELGKLQRIGSTVSELQGIFESLMNQLRNREELIAKAMNLYDAHVAKDLPKEAEKLVFEFGPPLLREVGRCRRLHEAYTAGVSAVCDFVFGPLNGVWFFSGLCILLASVLTPLGLLLLLHKIPSFSHSAGTGRSEPAGVATHETDHVKSRRHLPSVNGIRVVQPPGIHALIRGRDTQSPPSPSGV